MATKKKPVRKKTANSSKKQNKRSNGSKMTVPTYIISMVIITLLISIFMYVDTGDGGVINHFIRNVFCGLFGICGYFIPLLLVGITAYLIKTKDIHKFWVKTGFAFLALINISAITNLATPETSISPTLAYVDGAESIIGGGFFGACVSIFLERMVQTIAAYIILFITLIILASVISNVNIITLAVDWVKKALSEARVKYDDYKEEHGYYDEDFYEEENKKTNILDAAISMQKDPKKQKNKPLNEAPKKADTQKTETTDTFSDGIDDIFSKMEREDKKPDTPASNTNEKAPEPAVEAATDETAAKPKEKPQRVDNLSEKEKAEINKEFDRPGEQPKIEYITPPLKLLSAPKAISGDKREEMRRTAEKLQTASHLKNRC